MFISTRVMVGGQTITVYYLTEEGKKIFEGLVASEKYNNTRIDTVFEQIRNIRDELIETFFLEKMQVHIIESLNRSPNQTLQMVAKDLPDFSKSPMIHHAFYEAWKQFEKSGVIVPTSHGPRTSKNLATNHKERG